MTSKQNDNSAQNLLSQLSDKVASEIGTSIVPIRGRP
jgi:hypothetical protein